MSTLLIEFLQLFEQVLQCVGPSSLRLGIGLDKGYTI